MGVEVARGSERVPEPGGESLARSWARLVPGSGSQVREQKALQVSV